MKYIANLAFIVSMWPELPSWAWWTIAMWVIAIGIISLAFIKFYSHRNNLTDWLRKNKIINIVGGVVLVVAVSEIVGSFERPYLTIMNAEVIQNDQGIEEFSVSLRNNTDYPAEEMISQLIIIPDTSNMNTPPIIGDEMTETSMGPHGPKLRHWMGVNIKPNIKPAFVVFQISYSGPLSDERFSEKFYYKFLGWPADDESFNRKLVGTNTNEDDWIEEYIRKHEIQMF